jgi:glycosyltransferase involved in cell wall biosynthesis
MRSPARFGPFELPQSTGTGVSVVVPVYNGRQFLSEAVASIYAQTAPPDEVIVVNDGSTDDTEELLRRLEADLPESFHWVSRPHRGEASARNTGLGLAHGEFVAFIDHDDRWYPEKLAKQLGQLASEPELGLSFTGYHQTDGATATLVQHAAWDSDPAAVLRRLMRSCVVGPPSCVLARRAALERVPAFDERLSLGCDWLMWLNLAAAGIRIGYVPEPLFEYRWHGGNLSRGPARYYESACQIFERFFETDRPPISFQGRDRDPGWWRARWHMLAAVNAVQTGAKTVARRHILRAAMLRPASIRPGWVRMLGVGTPPR